MGPENFAPICPTVQKLLNFFEVTDRHTDRRTHRQKQTTSVPQENFFFAYLWGRRRETLQTLQNFYLFTLWKINVAKLIWLLWEHRLRTWIGIGILFSTNLKKPWKEQNPCSPNSIDHRVCSPWFGGSISLLVQFRCDVLAHWRRH